MFILSRHYIYTFFLLLDLTRIHFVVYQSQTAYTRYHIENKNELMLLDEWRKYMKYITFTVPCFNSEDYMERCIDSLLAGGDDVEIIIIDDGSTDKTAQIADYYADVYPKMVKVIHKENGGYGSGINTGLELSTGYYYKVIDSDDWLDIDAYMKLLAKIKFYVTRENKNGILHIPDMFVCNYVYDHLEGGQQKVMSYNNVFPNGRHCNWNTMHHFHPSQYLIMHALIFRTEALRQSNVILPEHTFYVDKLFAFQPLPFVRDIFYMDIDLYHYYLGRDDQSINEQVLLKRIDQQLYVTNLVSKCTDLQAVGEKYPKLAKYMIRSISIMMTISTIHLLLINNKNSYEKRKHLWYGIKKYNKSLYYRLRFTTLSGITYIPGKVGGKIVIGGYRIAKRIYKFQ